MTRLLVTGAAGFIGSNFVRRALETAPHLRLIAYDALTYAGNLANLSDVLSDERLTFVRGDICDSDQLDALPQVDAIINFAAESHVDRSIMGSAEFVRTNIQGVHTLLEYARRTNVSRLVQVSTDEVYGSLGSTGKFTEESPLAPNSPYSASKAAGDLLARAYHETHKTPVIVTRCSNNYGPYQFPEKVIPLFITNRLQDLKVPLYGDGLNVRDWIHVQDHCDALLLVLDKGAPGVVYNIGGGCEITNLELTREILRRLDSDESCIERVTDRPAHDRRYAVDFSRISSQLGWQPEIDFAEGLSATVDWYRRNEAWWRAVKDGQYLEYYNKQYAQR
ncbi:MAG: dTDP-glucose 4,6-dehydratase [Phycisphaerales bacterium]|nr:dTDP-glucose 4,6-dehydratase [Phycisphaerales bacterium]